MDMPHPTFFIALPHLRGLKMPGDVPMSEVEAGAFGYAHLVGFNHPEWPRALDLVWEKLPVGGLLIWTQPQTNIQRKNFGEWTKLLKSGWTCIEDQDEVPRLAGWYYCILRKRDDGQQIYEPFQIKPRTALIFRPGGLGDGLCALSIAKSLTEQGYEVDYLTTPEAGKAAKNNPFVRNLLVYDHWRVEGEMIMPMLSVVDHRYERLINGNEIFENQVLFLPGKSNYAWDIKARRMVAAKINVEELTFAAAGLDFRPGEMRFYPTQEERGAAEVEFNKLVGMDRQLVVWPIHGSARQKFFPFTGAAVARILSQRTNVVVAFTGADGRDDEAIEHVRAQAAQFCGDETLVRMVNLVGLPVREAFALAQLSDVVCGPETGCMNAVAYEDGVEKIILLSHSSADNLPKHWYKTTVIEPKHELFPCCQMHYSNCECPTDSKTGRSVCSSSISIDEVVSAVLAALDRSAKKLERAA